MTDWQRLEQVIKWTGLSTNAFATGIGLKRSENLYQIKRGNNRISKNLAEAIVRKYNTVNLAWLLTGEGEMLAGQADRQIGGPNGEEKERQKGEIPYYNIDVLRLVSEGYDRTAEQRRQADDWIRMPGFGDCDFAAVVTGDAMAPEVPIGAVVAVKQVDPAGPVLPGEIYVAVTAEFALMRYVRLDRKAETDGRLRLEPPEGSGAGTVEVLRERLVKLYLVKGIVVHKVL